MLRKCLPTVTTRMINSHLELIAMFFCGILVSCNIILCWYVLALPGVQGAIEIMREKRRAETNTSRTLMFYKHVPNMYPPNCTFPTGDRS